MLRYQRRRDTQMGRRGSRRPQTTRLSRAIERRALLVVGNSMVKDHAYKLGEIRSARRYGLGEVALRSIILLAAILMELAPWGAVRAETRVALVIGNAKYVHVAHLRNPTNDATAVANVLRR